MRWKNFCQICKQTDCLFNLGKIKDLFWHHYENINIYKMLYYAFKIMDKGFEPYLKEAVIRNLQNLCEDRRYDHMISKVVLRKEWTEQERIEYFMVFFFLHNYKKKMITIENLLKLKPREFEVFCSDILRQLGYTSVRLTTFTRDEGFDFSFIINGVFVLGECKRYGPKSKVRPVEVSRLVDAIGRKKAQKGIFITTSSFTDACKKEQKERDVDIEFWDGNYLMNLIKEKLNLTFFRF